MALKPERIMVAFEGMNKSILLMRQIYLKDNIVIDLASAVAAGGPLRFDFIIHISTTQSATSYCRNN
jgi:hypothetical protein